ncbi:potential GTPase activator [Pseudozyma hubeiensis SY62]|uniref:Potential GTPase activator n=1 Tax=Pseudozyma hubeiensis (strain SY62) TaxID=1305764 RepID=R9P9B2_PSEHS|nr:potential GTPase activator [Pseudozyma hubeiensis SY62]GAC94685.1 potential GTPase activator [Pseudozyma hubeiensis SY62]
MRVPERKSWSRLKAQSSKRTVGFFPGTRLSSHFDSYLSRSAAHLLIFTQSPGIGNSDRTEQDCLADRPSRHYTHHLLTPRMSLPSSLTVVYPPSFQNSFWTHPSYRPGAHSLYAKLQAGLDENESILAFVAHRAELEYNHAEALATPPPPPSFAAPFFKQAAGILHEVLPIDGHASTASTRGFTANTSATSRAFRMIQAETNTTHANAHGKIARHLEKSILEPFGKWAADHRQRVTQSWEHVDATLGRFERHKAEVDKLKNSYENKCRIADEAEDDARFAPIDESDGVQSPPARSSDSTLRPPAPPGSGIQRRSVSAGSNKSIEGNEDETDAEKLKRRETVRKQFGFSQRATSATLTSPSAENDFAGVKLPPLPTETEGQALLSAAETSASSLKRSGTISAFVNSAVEKMPAPIKAAVGGVVSAELRHLRLRRDADNAEKVYEEAVRNLDRTRCHLEEVLFEHYGLTQRWEADRIRAVQSVLASYNQAISAQGPILQQSTARSFKIHQGLDPTLELRALIRQARTGPFHPAIERFQPYYHDETSLGRKAGAQGVAHGWLVKNGGFGLNLSLVERLDYLERLERQQSGSAPESNPSQQLATLPPVLTALLAALDRAYADTERWNVLVKALSAPVNETDDAAESTEEKGEVDSKLIGKEKRKIWILEVPLSITHRLRDALIAHLNPSLADRIYGGNGASLADGNPIPDKLLDAYDPPVLAACIKLWLLELEYSLITEDLWDQIDSVYRAADAQEHEALASTTPTMPSAREGVAREDIAADSSNVSASPAKKPEIDDATRDKIKAGVLEDLRVVLNKLPKIHLACLDAIFGHLRKLLLSTESTESDEVYANKLGLAFGRALLRPQRETAYTVSSQIGTLVVVDLVQHYDSIFPELVEKKLKEVATPNGKKGWQRPTPIRKRTKPVDQRISRSSIGSDLQQGAKIFVEQMGRSEEQPPLPEKQLADSEKTQAMPPVIDTSSSNATAQQKMDDDLAAPTPLTDRMLSSSHQLEAETISAASETAESTKLEDDDTKPLSNVARLSRQFGALGSGGATGATSKRTSLGGVRGPRPAGARSARMSGQFSASSDTSVGAEPPAPAKTASDQS